MTKNNQDSSLYQEKPWVNNDNNIWLASTLQLYRNFEKFHYPIKLGKDRRSQIVSLASKEILRSPHLRNPYLIKAEDIGPIQKEYLVEHFLSIRSFHQAHSGEAFILDETGRFLLTFNVGNHVQFEMIDYKGEIEPAWNQIVKIETELGQVIQYAFSPKFGFLTSNMTNCGTGFVLTAFLQLSALIHTGLIHETLDRMKNDAVTFTGITGNPKEIIGDIYALSNHFTLGLTEENIISTIRLLVTKLLVEEATARSHLQQGNNIEVKNKVSRAFGLLVHSYQIEVIEALNAIGLLKLGVHMGWLKGLTPLDLNILFFSCRRAHLLSRCKENVIQEEIAHKRAEYIHTALKNAALTI